MKTRMIFLLVFAFATFNIHAQTPTAPRVPLAEDSLATDGNGREVLRGRLRTTDLRGAIDSPITNVLLVLENRGSFVYTYVSGWAMFYNAEGIRCGEGLFKLDVLGPGESAETDTPGLRLRCAPATWRIVPNNLLTPAGDTGKPNQADSSPYAANGSDNVMIMPQLEIIIDGETLPLQLGNPIEINTRRKRRIHIVVNARP